MKLASLIFFGDDNELNSIILKKLNIVEFKPASNEYKGLYLIENKFGQQDLRKIDLDFSPNAAGDWLIYKYLTNEEVAAIESNSSNKRIYVLLHSYFSVDHLMSVRAIANKQEQINYIVDTANDEFKTTDYAQNKFNTKNIFQLQKNKLKKTIQNESAEKNLLLSFLSPLVKLLLNPSQELGQLITVFRYSNLRYFSRALELALFIHFFVIVVLAIPLRNAINGQYYFTKKIAGMLKVLTIKFGYAFRHLLLITGFKSFGFFVDLRNSAERFKNRFLKLVYYDYLQRIYYDKIKTTLVRVWLFLSKMYYKYAHAFYHKVLVSYVSFLYYQIVHRLYHSIFLRAAVAFLIYKVFTPLYDKVFVQFFYYKVVHNFYHNVILKIFSILIYRILQPVYYKLIVQFLFYKVVHNFYNKVLLPSASFLFYSVLQKIYYKIILEILLHKVVIGFLYNRVILNFFFYKVGYGYLLPAYYNFLNILRYKLRHWILMSYYNLYGFLYDCCTFSYRVFKLYLMYPIFKIYWFVSFQFNKRIRKTIK